MALENPALNERSFQRGIEEAGTEPRGMTAAGTYAITGLLFVIVVTLVVSVGVLWLSGDATRGVRMGVICGAVAVFTVSAVSWAGRSGERSGDEHERSRSGQDC